MHNILLTCGKDQEKDQEECSSITMTHWDDTEVRRVKNWVKGNRNGWGGSDG